MLKNNQKECVLRSSLLIFTPNFFFFVKISKFAFLTIFSYFSHLLQLVNDYLRDNYYTRLGISGRNVRDLNIAACRLMLDITPGLETSAVFETVSHV